MPRTRVVVVGGGIAGVGFARALAERAGDSVEITIVTKDTFYASGPSRPLLLTGEQRYERIIRGYEELARAGVRVVYGKVVGVDPGERVVLVEEQSTVNKAVERIGYDLLLLAPGVVYDGSGIEGYGENWWRSANVYEIGRVDVLRKRIWSIDRGTVVVYAPPMPYRCAPAPSETTMAIHTVLQHRGVREKVRLVHVDANDRPQPPVIADVIRERFEEAGVELVAGQEIVEVTPTHVVLGSGERIEYTVLAMLEPNRAPRFIEEAGLGAPWGEVRSPTDLRSKKYDDILIAGDAAKLPFPKNQEIAYESALYAANKALEMLGVGAEPLGVQYTFLGWAYLGNLDGRLETESVLFGLNFATKPPRPTKDPVPKREHTLAKDRWEQGYLDKLYGYHPVEAGLD